MSQVGTKLDANQVLKQAYNEADNRIRVDAVVSASIGQVEIIDANGDELNVNADGSLDVNVISPLNVEIDAADGDNIAINDGTNTMVVNPDGSIDVNIQNALSIEIDAADGDSVMIVGTEDGTPTGTQHTLKVDSDLDLHVRDDDANITLDALLLELTGKTEPADAQNIRSLTSVLDSITVPGVATEAKQDVANTSLSNIDNKLPASLGAKPAAQSLSVTLPSDQPALTVHVDAFTNPTPDNVQLVGSIDGLITGTKYGFVNNLRQQVLASHDRIANFTYADFGTKNQRITQIDYVSPTFPGVTVQRVFSYTLVTNRYRRDDETWAII